MKRITLLVFTCSFTLASSAQAQIGNVSVGDNSQLVLYGLGLVNTLLMALLMYHMNSAAKQRASRDSEINATLREVQRDLKTLNDSVLGQYVTKQVHDQVIASLHQEIEEEKKLRAAGDAKSITSLHRFELALAKANIAIPAPATPDD